MKELKKLYILTAISVTAFSILFCVFILNFSKTSYAIETGTFTNGYPTSSFSTNMDTTNPVNYVSNAFGSDNSYANYLNNFIVQDNYLDNNNTNPLYQLMKNMETPKSTETFGLTSESVNEINDSKLIYIINHGYNITNSVNTVFSKNKYDGATDNKIKQYITQVALWLYIYENKSNYTSTYCKPMAASYSSCDFVDTSNNVVDVSTVRTMITKAAQKDNYAYLNYILELVDNAKNYSGGEQSSIGSFSNDFSYSISSDNSKFYIYNLLPNITGNKTNYMYYAVEVEDPNSYGVYIADKNDNKIENTNQLVESFSVVVPIKDDITKMDLSSISINVYAYFVVDQNKSYTVTQSTGATLPGANSNLVVKYEDNKYDRYSKVALGYTPYQIIKTQFNLRNFTVISKIDATNSSELPGATLVITKKDDESKKWTWVSTDKPHYISLEDGDYKLCETLPPDGYELTTECIDFTVTNNKTNLVTMKNKKIEVPNTASMFNKAIVFVGLFLVIFGSGIISYYMFMVKSDHKKRG